MVSFIKKTWADGDQITANDLNRIEDGIANAGILSRDAVELKENKVQSLSGSTIADQYPSVQAVMNYIINNLQDATYKRY